MAKFSHWNRKEGLLALRGRMVPARPQLQGVGVGTLRDERGRVVTGGDEHMLGFLESGSWP